MEAFRLVTRLHQAEDTICQIGQVKIGGGHKAYLAGPCSVENEDQITKIAIELQGYAHVLRGGAYKPRSSPYSFQGLGEDGLRLLQKAGRQANLPVVTEVVTPEDVDLVASYVDMLQIGARNMQNYALLKKVGAQKKPVLLKRGLAASIDELLFSAEYILAEGNSQVVLCERGIRTYHDQYTRNTLDLSAVPILKELSHLPVLVDPSHGTGQWNLVEPLAKAAMAVGADGLLIEVHHEPEQALSDGFQSLKPDKYRRLIRKLNRFVRFLEEDQGED